MRLEKEIDGLLYSLDTDEQVATVKECNYRWCQGEVTIPDSFFHEGIVYRVTSIGERAFAGRSLTAITIPESVASIGNYAFIHCNSLTAITVAERNLVYDSRGDCNAIIETNSNTLVVGCAKTVIPKSVTSIGSYAFYECSSLTAINIPEGVTSIGNCAFHFCEKLTSITIPEGVTSIGNYAFDSCEKLTSINIPESVISIGEAAFDDCYNLTAVHINNIAAWCNIKFSNHKSNPLWYAHNLFLNGELVTDLILPESVKCIGNYAFRSCRSLVKIYIPKGVSNLGDCAFIHCNNLTTINIAEDSQLTSIGEAAFCGCSSLTEITIPKKVRSIGRGAFCDCKLKTVINYSKLHIQEGCHFDGGYTCYYAKKVIYADKVINDYAFKTIDGVHYLNGYIGNDTELTLPNNYKNKNYHIGDNAFKDCSSLSAITIPEGVMSIGESAFLDCKRLTSITIPEGVKRIRNEAFKGCCSLTTIHIPKSVKSIGNKAFHDCHNLTAITFSENSQLTNIGESAFEGCHSLTTIYIPKSVKSIGERAFAWCRIIGITIPESSLLTSIGTHAFLNSGLTAITIPKGVTSIEYGVFHGCSLTEITLPKGIMSIGNTAFSGCSNLTEITIPESVTSIGHEAFAWCSRLTAIKIPESVTSIGSYAFRRCSSLTSITIPKSVTSIERYAFSGFSGLTSILIPKSVKSIGGQAFQNTGIAYLTILGMPTIGKEAFEECENLTDVYCYSEEVPPTNYNAFGNLDLSRITLHVPESAMEQYKNTEPWSKFGTIVAIK